MPQVWSAAFRLRSEFAFVGRLNSEPKEREHICVRMEFSLQAARIRYGLKPELPAHTYGKLLVMTRTKLRLAIVAWMLGALSLHCSGPQGTDGHLTDGQLMGQPAPAFELRDLEGHRVSLDQLRGKIVMLDFWATWCGPCQISMPIMDKLQKEFSSDVVLLAINVMEPVETVREYVSRQNVRSKVLLDPGGNVGEEYGSDAIPMQVIIDRQGVVQHVNVGLNPRMEALLREEINRLRATNY